MIGFFINITGLLNCLGAPFGALGSAAGSLAAANAQKRAARLAAIRQFHANLPVVVERPTNIPKVEKRA